MGSLAFLDRLRAAASVVMGRSTSWGTFFQTERLKSAAGDVPDDNPYGWNPWVYRGLNLIAENIAGLPFQLSIGVGDQRVPVERGPWHRLFQQPNASYTWHELVVATVVWLLAAGEVMWVLEGDGDDYLHPFEIPSEVWPVIGGNAWEPVIDPRTKLVESWKAGAHEWPADCVVQFKLFNPKDPLRGLSALAPAMGGIRSDHKAAVWNERFFDNGADPGGTLTSDQVIHDSAVRERLRAQFEGRHRGYDRSHRVAFLEGGVKYTPHQVKHTDMAFLEQRKWSRSEVAVVLGIPEWFLGVTSDLNRATANSAERILWRNNLKPFGSKLGATITRRMIGLRDPGAALGLGAEWTGKLRGEFEFDEVEALQEDFDKRLESAERMTRIGYGLNVVNRRFSLGMPDVEGGEVGVLPMGYMPTPQVLSGDLLGFDDATSSTPPLLGSGDSLLMEAEPVQDQALNGAQIASLLRIVSEVASGALPFDAGVAVMAAAFPSLSMDQVLAILGPAAANGQPLETVGGDPAKKLLAALEASRVPRSVLPRRLGAGPAAIRRRGDVERGELWSRLERSVLAPNEQRYARRMHAYLYTVRGQLLRELDKLDRAFARDTNLAEIDALLDRLRMGWDRMLSARTAPLYQSMFQDGAASVLSELSSPVVLGMESPDVVAFLGRKQIKVRGINRTIRQAVRSVLAEGIADGEPATALQSRVRRVFNAAASRTFTIARTEVGQTVNGARDVAMGAAGVETYRWITARDGVVRPSHVAMDGLEVRRGYRFPNGLRHPCDMEGDAREIVNCRCMVAPVL